MEERLISVVDDLLTSYRDDSLHTFSGQWAQLVEEVINGHGSGPRREDDSTLYAAIDVASCIQELCDTFISLARIDDDFRQRVSEAVPTNPDDDDDDTPIPANLPQYVKPASEWLLNNLHNPFPPTEFREELSVTYSLPRKNVDTWFNEARKRIGWNSIRKKHFSSRKEMVDAASAYFLDPLTSGEFDCEFLKMAKKAKDLYAKRLSTSELMQRLDRSVKTMSDEVKRQAEEEKRERQREKRRVSYKREGKAATPPATPVAGKKRRSHNDFDEQPSRKRSRSHDDDDDDSASPSGPSSRRASSLFSEAPTESTSATELSLLSSTSGKRRASDSFHDRPHKRPRTSSAPPMTLPTCSVDNWFKKAQSQAQIPTDAEISYDISPWLASLESFSDSDSSGVTTPTDFPSIIPLPDINEADVLLELGLPTASSSLLPVTTDSLFDLCSPFQTNLPDYDYTSPDFLDFNLDSDLLGLETSNSSLGSLDPSFSIGVTV